MRELPQPLTNLLHENVANKFSGIATFVLVSVTRRYAVSEERRHVFLLTAVRFRSVMPITSELIFRTALASSHSVTIRQTELTLLFKLQYQK